MSEFEERYSTHEEKGFPKQPLSFIDSIRRQIERCLMFAYDEEAFATNVGLLIKMLPPEVKESKEFKERYNACFQKVTRWHYVKNANMPMGTPDDPVCDEHGNPISPVLVEEEDIDYASLFQLALDMLDKIGILYERKPKVREVWK